MKEKIEIESLDLRYETYRLKSPAAEKILLTSILENGIRDPLQGINKNDNRILLNGFKRYRCAKKLGSGIVPYISLGEDEAYGIIQLIRASNSKGLTILEQAILIDELNTIHNMGNADIAGLLEKSKAWVSVRTGIIRQMSSMVKEKVFNGDFPVYSYMYTLQQFIRINSVKKSEVDEFVHAVSGKGFSIRDINMLANAYFKGGEDIRHQIKNGNTSWCLRRLKEPSGQNTGCTKNEQKFLNALERVQHHMHWIIKSDRQFKTAVFDAQANILTGGILRMTNAFTQCREWGRTMIFDTNCLILYNKLKIDCV